jgi:hypothetical protein
MRRRPEFDGLGGMYAEALFAPLFDYQLVRAVLAYQSFFEYPIGSNLQGKVRTDRDTNMVMAGCLPAGNSFLITGVRVLFIPDYLEHRGNREADEQDAARMLLGGSLRLRIANREYLNDAPLAKFPTCLPRTWMAELHYRNDEDEEPHWRALYDPSYAKAAGLAYYKITPLHVSPHQQLGVTILHEPGPLNAPARLGVIIDGHRIRGAA